MVDRRGLIQFLSSAPIGQGGYARVFKARRRTDGQVLAFKALHTTTEYALRRMRREIQAQRGLAHPNIMPIWDVDPDQRWFTMPLAEANLEELRGHLDEEDLVTILSSVAAGLQVAHTKMEIHRDLTPTNILAIRDESAEGGRRWVIGDWGHVRVPTSNSVSPLTRGPETPLGTDGYAAPELLEHGHDATPATDFYSLGRIAAWFLTKQRPRGERPLYPPREMQHWRAFVRACTELDVRYRVSDIGSFQRLLGEVLERPHIAPLTRCLALLEEALQNGNQAVTDIESIAEDHPDDFELYVDGLAGLPGYLIADQVAEKPETWERIGSRMARFLLEEPWGDRDSSYIATPLGFIYRLLRRLTEVSQLGLAEDLARLFFKADLSKRCESQRLKTVEWLADLSGSTAAAISRALRATAGAARYYSGAGLPEPRDQAIADALRVDNTT